MWMGLIAGLLVAAVLLSTRFLRSSRWVPAMPPSTVTDGG
jgi:multidrug resistance protein, MATE family